MTRDEFLQLNVGDTVELGGNSKYKGERVTILALPKSEDRRRCLVSGGNKVYSFYSLVKVGN